jgi:hypothetical protein
MDKAGIYLAIVRVEQRCAEKNAYEQSDKPDGMASALGPMA